MRFEEYKESFKGGQGREDEEIMELGEKMALLFGSDIVPSERPMMPCPYETDAEVGK